MTCDDRQVYISSSSPLWLNMDKEKIKQKTREALWKADETEAEGWPDAPENLLALEIHPAPRPVP